jgi:predicted transcriptional regulator
MSSGILTQPGRQQRAYVMAVIPRKAARITPKEIAEKTGIPLRAITVAIKSGALPSKNGKVTLTDFIAWNARRGSLTS